MSVFKKIQNITLEEYLTLLEQMKQAALSDMDSFPEKEKYMGDVQPGSFLGVRLRYRDDEDCLYADCSSAGPRPFARLRPYLWQFMEEESEELLGNEDFDEPAENKFYWEVTKYFRCRDRFYEQYAVIYSLKLEIRKGLDITDLCGVVDTCCDPALLKAAEMLKENPAIFWKWLDWRETGQSLEEKILAVRGVSI